MLKHFLCYLILYPKFFWHPHTFQIIQLIKEITAMTFDINTLHLLQYSAFAQLKSTENLNSSEKLS